MDPISVTTAEACRMIGIGKTTLWRLIGSGELETARIGGRVLIPVSSIRSLIENATGRRKKGFDLKTCLVSSDRLNEIGSGVGWLLRSAD